MNAFKVQVRHNTDFIGQAKNKEEVLTNLEIFLSQLEDTEVLSIEDLGPAEEFFNSAAAQEYAPVPGTDEPTPTTH